MASPKNESARQKLIQVATKLFAESGLEGVSVRDIAGAAGVNLSLVSYYFGGKEGLYKTILEEHAHKVSADMAAVLLRFHRRGMNREIFIESIRGLITLLLDMRLKQPAISRLMLRERLCGMPHARHVYEEIFAPIGDQVVLLIRDAQEFKVVHKDLNPRSYFVSLIESILGYVTLHDCKLKVWKDAYRLPKDKKEYIDFLVRLYTEGVCR